MAEKYFRNLWQIASRITVTDQAPPSGVKWINLAGQIVQWFHPAARGAQSSFAWHGFKTDKVGRSHVRVSKDRSDSNRATAMRGSPPK